MTIPSQVTTSRNGTFHSEQLFRTLDVGELLWKPDLPSSRIMSRDSRLTRIFSRGKILAFERDLHLLPANKLNRYEHSHMCLF